MQAMKAANGWLFMGMLLMVWLVAACSSTPSRSVADAGTTIAVNVDKTEDFDFHDYFDTVRYIPLETTDDALIGEVTKLYLTQENILVFDQKTMSLFLFDARGRFVRKIGNKGEGPDEYMYINDVQLDAKHGLVYVHERIRNRIYIYDLSGKLLEQSAKASVEFNSFFRTEEGVWVYSCFKDNNPGHYNLTLLSSDLQTVKKQYFPQKEFVNVTFESVFTGDGRGRAFFYYPSSNIIYELDGTDVDPYLCIDFGSRTVPYDQIREAGSMEECDKLLADHAYLGDIQHCFVTRNRVFFSFSEMGAGMGPGYKCFYDSESGETRVFKAPFMSSVDYPIALNLLYASDDLWVYPLYPSLFSDESFEKLRKTFDADIQFDSNLILAVCHLKEKARD